VNFSDVKIDDPRWSETDRVVLTHLFRTRQRYINEHRRLEAHGMAKAIYVMANVLEAYRNPALPDSTPDPFRTLL
jgi:hypothetical protein